MTDGICDAPGVLDAEPPTGSVDADIAPGAEDTEIVGEPLQEPVGVAVELAVGVSVVDWTIGEMPGGVRVALPVPVSVLA